MPTSTTLPVYPGWKTDRGRIYITFGPPDEIESHPSGGTYERPPEEGGGTTSTFPFEQWRYRYIEDIGNDIIIEFVDPTMSGEYRMTMDPSEKDALLYVPGAGLTLMEQMGMSDKTDRFNRTDGTHLGVPFGGETQKMNEFNRLEQFAKLQRAPGGEIQGSRSGRQFADQLQHPADEGPGGLLPRHRRFGPDLYNGAVRQQGSAVPGEGRRPEGRDQHVRPHHYDDAPHGGDARSRTR